MRLYIAEKPSVARELATVLGSVRRQNGYIETKGGIVTWLFGHILRQAEPNEYDEKYKRWNIDDLPIIPSKWQLLVSDTAAAQFNTVKDLISKADEIVHAGDPDREGQLLVDEVLDYLNCKKPIKRILLNALDEESIKDANANLKENKDFRPLMLSALARARADWLIGMNLSRAYTIAARRAGYEDLILPIGRVKIPTLALVVRREREITNFKPTNHYIIKATFLKKDTEFTTKWQPNDEMKGLDSEGRLIDKEVVKAKEEDFAKEPHDGVIASYEKKKKKELMPLPFSLSSLQVMAGKRFGYAPQLVLDTAQKLYEKKLTTYPRSDSEYLPENQFKDAERILNNLSAISEEFSNWTKGANTKQKSRTWNDKKVSAHHAIIPTKVPVNFNALTEEERNIYFLVARQYIAQFYPEHTYYGTKLEIEYHCEIFTATGNTEIDAGWKALYKVNKKEAEDENETLPPMKKGDKVTFKKSVTEEKTTKPPARFKSSTLLAAMKGIHAYVKDESLKKQLKSVYGIGTEATRATIIDELIKRGFMEEKDKGKDLVPTERANLMIDLMPDDMTYPDKTAVWEEYLGNMANKKGTLENFISEQIDFINDLITKSKEIKIKPVGKFPCPCGNGALQKRKGKNGDFWGCSNYPTCRITAEDKNGEPNMDSIRQRRNFSNNVTKEDIAFLKKQPQDPIAPIESGNQMPDDVLSLLNG